MSDTTGPDTERSGGSTPGREIAPAGGGQLRYAGRPYTAHGTEPTNLADLLERILDKGIVIAGDIAINLVDIELLTIKLRLLVASVDKAREMGVNWWESDPWLNSRAADQARDGGGDDRSRELDARLERIESALARIGGLPEGERAGEGRR